MKKIITAAAIAAMAAGFATADAKFSFNYRTGIDAAQHVMSDEYGDSHGTKFLSNESKGRSTAGALSFSGSADYGGVQIEIEPSESSGSNSLKLTKYNGWINWGNFMLKSGAWDSSTAARVNGSAGAHEGKFFGELTKPGLANKLGTNGKGIEISQQSGKKQSTMLQYNNKDLGLEVRLAYMDTDGGSTTETTTTTYGSTVSGVTYDSSSETLTYTSKSETKTNKKDVTTKTSDTNTGTFATTKGTYGNRYDEESDYVFANNQWFIELGYTVKGVGKILGTSKIIHNDYAFAAFFQPKLDSLKALDSMVGFTFETNRKGFLDASQDWQALNAYGLDFRARYDLKDAGVPLAITFMYNWTFGEMATNAKVNDNVHGVFASWGMVNLRYQLNETIAPFFSAIYMSGVSTTQDSKTVSTSDYAYLAFDPTKATAQKFDDPYNFSMRLYGGVEIGNPKTAILITGVLYDASNMMERGTTKTSVTGSASKKAIHGTAGTRGFTIPVLMKVSF